MNICFVHEVMLGDATTELSVVLHMYILWCQPQHPQGRVESEEICPEEESDLLQVRASLFCLAQKYRPIPQAQHMIMIHDVTEGQYSPHC